MNADMTHQQHAELIAEQTKQETKTKYLAGAEKYGTKLWEYSIPSLVDNAIEESLDEGTYLRTMRQLVAEARAKLAELFDILENPKEEPLDDEALDLMDDIKLLLDL